MTTIPQELLIERFYAAFARRDGAGMEACYTPDVRFSDPVFTELHGPEAGAMWRMLTERASDLRLDVGPSQVVQLVEASDGRFVAEGAVWATMVVDP